MQEKLISRLKFFSNCLRMRQFETVVPGNLAFIYKEQLGNSPISRLRTTPMCFQISSESPGLSGEVDQFCNAVASGHLSRQSSVAIGQIQPNNTTRWSRVDGSNMLKHCTILVQANRARKGN